MPGSQDTAVIFMLGFMADHVHIARQLLTAFLFVKYKNVFSVLHKDTWIDAFLHHRCSWRGNVKPDPEVTATVQWTVTEQGRTPHLHGHETGCTELLPSSTQRYLNVQVQNFPSCHTGTKVTSMPQILLMNQQSLHQIPTLWLRKNLFRLIYNHMFFTY